MQTAERYNAPIVVNLVNTKSKYSAVGGPGLIPGTNPPFLF